MWRCRQAEAFDLMVDQKRGRLVYANHFNVPLSALPPKVHNFFYRGGSSGLLFTFSGLFSVFGAQLSWWQTQGPPQAPPQGGSSCGSSFTFSGLLFTFSGLLFTFSGLSSWWPLQGLPQAFSARKANKADTLTTQHCRQLP